MPPVRLGGDGRQQLQSSLESGDVLLAVRDLRKYFPVGTGFLSRKKAQLKAVDGVSFEVRRGETLGLVGESGCGKTTVARLILRLLAPTSGDILFNGKSIISSGSRDDYLAYRRGVQAVFQDPSSSLNPRMSIRESIGEALKFHHGMTDSEREARTRELLESVGFRNEYSARFPHQLSGGEKQRVSIARSLAVEPQLVVLDEPISSLDVSIQAQVINLLKELKRKHNLSYIFIAHDLSVVRHISDRVAIMYSGRIVETANTDELFGNPLHPYTKALLSAVPVPKANKRSKRVILRGDVPSPLNPPQGCRFHPRCIYAQERCSVEEPALRDFGAHLASCHYVETIAEMAKAEKSPASPTS